MLGYLMLAGLLLMFALLAYGQGMFGLFANANTAAAAGTENALTAVTDPNLTTNNNSFILTGDYRMLGDMGIGASVQYGRYNITNWNGWGRPTISAVNRNANPTAPIFWGDYRDQNLLLPQNQPLQVLLTNNLGASTEAEWHLWQLATPDWNMNLPPAAPGAGAAALELTSRLTFTATPVVGSWVQNITPAFDQTPLSGVWAVIAAMCIGANGVAFRINFPTSRSYNGRKMRPGSVILPSFGSLPPLTDLGAHGRWGLWGVFSTFEGFLVDLLGTTASSTTYNLFLRMRYLGSDVSIAGQWANRAY